MNTTSHSSHDNGFLIKRCGPTVGLQITVWHKEGTESRTQTLHVPLDLGVELVTQVDLLLVQGGHAPERRTKDEWDEIAHYNYRENERAMIAMRGNDWDDWPF